ncbi:MAG: lytic transglycosylase domain-containing protein [Sporomusa sp.]
MRSQMLALWLMLLCVLAAQVAAFSLSVIMADYSRRGVYAAFSAGAAARREISGLPYADKINQSGNTYGISPELIAAIIQAESSFQPHARSKAEAYGLMQVVPGTWKLVNSQANICSGRHLGACGADCFYDAELNIAIGSYYLSQLFTRYNGHAEWAVAAYNAGPGAVDKYGGIPPYAETSGYVARVIANWYEISGQLPPGGLSAYNWTKVAWVSGWSIVLTVGGLIAIGHRLFQRHKSLYWR